MIEDLKDYYRRQLVLSAKRAIRVICREEGEKVANAIDASVNRELNQEGVTVPARWEDPDF